MLDSLAVDQDLLVSRAQQHFGVKMFNKQKKEKEKESNNTTCERFST